MSNGWWSEAWARPMKAGEVFTFEANYLVNGVDSAIEMGQTVAGEKHLCPGYGCAFCLWRKNHPVRNHAS